MDIKLRARLSAYAKVDSIGHLQTFIPDPSTAKDGTVLGVDTGKYTLFPSLNNTDIDNMFQEPNVTVVDKSQIDDLFKETTEPESVTKTEIDKLFEESEEPEAVDKTEIDSLFKEEEDPESVTKEEIDNLFDETEKPTEDVETVSFADIDKLFK